MKVLLTHQLNLVIKVNSMLDNPHPSEWHLYYKLNHGGRSMFHPSCDEAISRISILHSASKLTLGKCYLQNKGSRHLTLWLTFDQAGFCFSTRTSRAYSIDCAVRSKRFGGTAIKNCKISKTLTFKF